eukprot:TRINITY_DN1867_c0_g1_i11.p1 TRINITY_DN1867_c0_g1~~TRINITY_DN1867_c0_g1_i11.p1  ORF type:complete len:242 (+),score=-18.96 TRINITY_DN1867_c0_g1_i11:1544-2269(+)
MVSSLQNSNSLSNQKLLVVNIEKLKCLQDIDNIQQFAYKMLVHIVKVNIKKLKCLQDIDNIQHSYEMLVHVFLKLKIIYMINTSNHKSKYLFQVYINQHESLIYRSLLKIYFLPQTALAKQNILLLKNSPPLLISKYKTLHINKYVQILLNKIIIKRKNYIYSKKSVLNILANEIYTKACLKMFQAQNFFYNILYYSNYFVLIFIITSTLSHNNTSKLNKIIICLAATKLSTEQYILKTYI